MTAIASLSLWRRIGELSMNGDIINHRKPFSGTEFVDWTVRSRRRRVGCAAFLALVLLMCAVAESATLDVDIDPMPPVAGESAQLRLTSETEVPTVTELPEVEGLEWLTPANSPQRSIRTAWINGRQRRQATAVYLFRVRTADRKYRIPAMKVRLDERDIKTDPHEFTATKPRVRTPEGDDLDLESALFTRLAFNGQGEPPEHLYVGESLRITLNVYVLKSIFSSMSYPELDIEDAVFRDYSEENPKFPRFRETSPRQVRRGNRMYVHVPFTFVLSPIRAGLLTGRLAAVCEIETGRADAPSGLGSSLFRRSRNRRRSVAAELPEIPVRPLPQVPADQRFLGLVGDWTVTAKLDKEEVRAGESVSFVLTAAGQGTLELLRKPNLNLPGFRAYEPEIERRSRGDTAFATLTWVLVPLAEDSRLPPLAFSTFDPEAEDFRVRRLTPELTVLPARKGANGSLTFDADNESENGDDRQRDTAKTDILYVKKSLGKSIAPPLWRRAVPHLLLGAAGPVVYLLLSAAARHRRRLRRDAGYRRRSSAARARSRALHKLRHAGEADRARIVREELVPALSAGLELPPGTTPTELAEQLRDKHPELADQLRQAEAYRYMPEQGQTLDVALIARQAGKLFVLLLLFAVGARAESSRHEEGEDNLLDAARTAYDRGHIEQALAQYRQLSGNNPGSPALLYNRGNCRYRLGEGGRAVALYERALRLAPRDSDIAENLRFVRRQLGLPDRSHATDPFELLASLRDSLRPDEWLILAGWTLFVWGVVGGGLQFRDGTPRWLHWLAAALVLLSVTAVSLQYRGPYRSGVHAVAVSASPKLLRLPAADAGTLDVDVREGRVLRVVEKRTDWMRVRVGRNEGWMPRDAIQFVW